MTQKARCSFKFKYLTFGRCLIVTSYINENVSSNHNNVFVTVNLYISGSPTIIAKVASILQHEAGKYNQLLYSHLKYWYDNEITKKNND